MFLKKQTKVFAKTIVILENRCYTLDVSGLPRRERKKMYGMLCRYFFQRKKTFYIAIIMVVVAFLIPLFLIKDCHSFSQVGMIDEIYFLNHQNNMFAQLFVYLLPLLLGFLFGDIWINQRKMEDIINIRVNRYRMYLANWFMSFILGFLLVMIFLILSLVFTFIMTYSLSTDIHVNINFLPEFAYHMIQGAVLFPELYIKQPQLWIFLYIFIVSVYGGVVAALGYVMGGIVRNKYIAFLLPFFLLMMLMIVLSVLNNGVNYSIQNVLFIGFNSFDNHIILLIVHLVALISLSLVLGFAALGRKK